MRIEIVRKTAEDRIDQDEIVTWLWEALNPLFEKTKGKIMIYMSEDLGENGDERGLVIYIQGLKMSEVTLRKIEDMNPSRRELIKEI